MPISLEPVRSFFSELKRRRVFRVGVAYLVAAWVVLQVADVVAPALGFERVMPLVIALVILGLPLALGLAWVYELTPSGLRRTPDKSVAKPPRTRQAAAQLPTRVAVLPLRVLRPDPDTDFLAFSLADAISCSLAGIQSLVVRSTAAATRHDPATVDLRNLATELDVDAVLLGTLLRSGAELQVRTQLARVPEGTLLWSHTSQVALGDLFALQENIARRILDALAVPLSTHEHLQLERDTPVTPRAYELYLRANQLSVQAGQWLRARELYEQCLKEDPGYAPAWARLARCHRLIAKFAPDTVTADRELRAAQDAFRRALELNPELPLAHSLFAQLEIDLGRAEDAMVRLLARSAAAGPDPEIMAGLVHACRFCGLLDASVAAHERARAVDANIRTSVAHTYFAQGRYQEAVTEYNNADIGYLEALALAMLGREQEAVALLRTREQSQSGTLIGPYLTSLRALLEGARTESLAAVEASLVTGLARDGEAIFYMARQLAKLGESDRAMVMLERAAGAGYHCMPAYQRDPWLEAVRELPDFKALLRRVQLRHHQACTAFVETAGERVLGISINRATTRV